jgi:hypothetical protein
MTFLGLAAMKTFEEALLQGSGPASPKAKTKNKQILPSGSGPEPARIRRCSTQNGRPDLPLDPRGRGGGGETTIQIILSIAKMISQWCPFQMKSLFFCCLQVKFYGSGARILLRRACRIAKPLLPSTGDLPLSHARMTQPYLRSKSKSKLNFPPDSGRH